MEYTRLHIFFMIKIMRHAFFQSMHSFNVCIGLALILELIGICLFPFLFRSLAKTKTSLKLGTKNSSFRTFSKYLEWSKVI